MRGLAFPPNGSSTPDIPDPIRSPSATLDDIPIDPALGGTPVDPALLSDAQPLISPQAPSPPVASPDIHNAHTTSSDQWSQERLPEGDPFAPQNTLPYSHMIPEPPAQPPHPLKPMKKRRRFHRDEECSFCQGNDAKNKVGEPELMVTCHECGRSGHPSCMELSKIGDMLRSYPWKCIECKNCELCGEKGDDEKILFCDGCDRGWHADCMQPPVNELPEGEWYCPLCQEAAAQHYFSPVSLAPQPPPEVHLNGLQITPIPPPPPPESNDETSVASSSRSIPPPTKPRPRGRPRKNKPVPSYTTNDDENEDVEVDVEGPVISVQTRLRVSRKRTRPSKRPVQQQPEEGEAEELEEVEIEDEVEVTVTQPRSTRKRKREREPDSSPASIPRVRLRLPTTRNSTKGKEKEEYEEATGMFEGILGTEDRDTSRTTVTNHDKQLFERSRLEAERKLVPPPPPPSATSTTSSRPFSRSSISISTSDTFDLPTAGPSRPTRSSTLQHTQAHHHHHHHHHPLPTPSPVPSTPGGSNLLPFAVRNDPETLRIKTIRFGQYDIKTWYDAPFPEEYASIADGRMWICEFCLKYMKSRFQAMRHRLKCKVRHPPGDEIYRDGVISIFEVDGRKNKIYCQNLCLLSKMFLDHKSLFYDVEPFLFYVITEVDDFGARFVGYFSKEKRSLKDYNLSCIMTLPVRQRQGWGNLLIDFSYLLSKVEQRTGSPEKPLSSLGALGYKNYWTLTIMRYLEGAPDHPRLQDISSATSMTLEDVYDTLAQQSMIFIREPTPPPIKPIPGQAIRLTKNRRNGSHPGSSSLRRSKSSPNQLYKAQPRQKSQDTPGVNGTGNGHHDGSGGPFVPPKHYEIRFDREKVKAFLRNWESKGYLILKSEKLQWTPYFMTRGGSGGSSSSGNEENKTPNGQALNGKSNGVTESDAESEVVMNGTQSEPDEKVSVSPRLLDQDQEDDEGDDELPVPGLRRTRSSRRESTQTPRRTTRRQHQEEQDQDQDQEHELRLQTPLKKVVNQEEDDARSLRRRNRMARKEEEVGDELLSLGLQTTPVSARKRRRVSSETGSKGCGPGVPDQVGSGKTGEEAGIEWRTAGVIKYEDAGTPIVHGSMVEMEMGDEDAEGSDEDAEGSADVECSI